MAPKKVGNIKPQTLKKVLLSKPLTKGQKLEALRKVKAKNIQKNKSLKKGTSGAGSSKDKAVKKNTLKKQPLKKGKLCAKNLNKLPQMTLHEKMEAAAEEASGDEDQAAENLKKSMTAAEKQSVWSKHQTHLKHNPKEQKALQKASKQEKGIAAAKWLMQKDGKKYLTTAAKVAASQALKKAEQWMSERAILKRWSPEELQAHLGSGRVVWREDPWTPGVYEYQDTQNWSREVEMKRQKKWESGCDHDPDEDAQAQFQQLYDNEAMSLGVADIGSYKGKGPSLGKGNHALGKGKAKGKGKRHPTQLAIEDGSVEDDEDEEEEEDEDEQVKKALKKVRKARDMVTTTQSNLEEALKKAKSQLSTKGKGNALQQQLKLEKHLKALKEVLLKKTHTSTGLKKLLGEVATVIKTAKDEVKELQQLANRAKSVSGNSKSSSRGSNK